MELPEWWRRTDERVAQWGRQRPQNDPRHVYPYLAGMVAVTLVSRTLLSGSELKAFFACVLLVTWGVGASWALLRARKPPPGGADGG